MIESEIPGFGVVKLKHLVSDFTGTLSVDGRLLPGVKERFHTIAAHLRVHILTADTFGRVKDELKDIRCEIHILEGANHDTQKEEYVARLGEKNVVAFGNGNNDRKMLHAARIGIAVCLNEGCARDAYTAADILVVSPVDAFDLLLNPERLKATLRF